MSDKKYLPSEIRRPSRYRSERLQKHSHITSSVNIVDGNIDHFVEWYNTVGRYIKYNSKAKAWYIDGDFYTTGQNAAGNIGSPNVDGNSGWLIDDELSGTSTNPVQNRAIKEYIDNNFFNLRTGGSIFGDVQFEGNSSYFKRALYNQGLIVGMQGSKSYGIKFDHVAHGGEELYANGGFLYYDTSDLSKRILFESDLKAYATQKDLSLVSGRLYAIENYFSTEEDADTYINKWNEIVAFLNATEGTTLDNILSSKADKVEIPTRVSQLENDKEYITSAAIANKVDKEEGKSLSSNDYTDEDKAKLAAISVGAEANVQSDWLEFNSNRPEYIKNKTHGITNVQNAIITIRPDATTEGTNLFEAYTDVPFMVNGIPYQTLDMLNKDFLVNDNIGPNVAFRVVEEGGSYFVKHIRGTAVVDYEYCNRVTITPLSDIYLPDTIARTSALEGFLKLSGGTLSGSIDFGRHPLLSAGAEFLLSLGGATTYLKGSTGIWLETPELYTKRDNKSYRVLDLGMDINAKTLGGLAETAFYRGKRASINISDLDTYVSRDVGAYSVAHSGHTSALLVLSKLTGGSNTSVEIYAPSYNPSLGLRLRFGIDSNRYSDWRDFAFLDDTISAAYKLVNSRGDDIVTINSNNNVIIGASSADSANYKLYVDGDIRAKNSIKIGEAIISWDNERSALKIVGNVYSTGQVAAGGFGNSDGGSGGGVILDYDSVVAALGFTPFDSAAFTKISIKNALGIADWALAANKPSYNFSEIGSKPATLSGYGITDAVKLGESYSAGSDLNDVKTAGIYTVYGGVANAAASGSMITLASANPYYIGQITVKYNGEMYSRSFVPENGGFWSDWRTVIDSVNVGDYTLPKTGGTITGALTVNANFQANLNILLYGSLKMLGGGGIEGVKSFTLNGETITSWAGLKNYLSFAFLELTGKPTTLAGYGITDGVKWSSSIGSSAVAEMGYGYLENGWYSGGPAISFGTTGYILRLQGQIDDTDNPRIYTSFIYGGVAKGWAELLTAEGLAKQYLDTTGLKVGGDLVLHRYGDGETYLNYGAAISDGASLHLYGKEMLFYVSTGDTALRITENKEAYFTGGIGLNSDVVTSWSDLKSRITYNFLDIGNRPATLSGYGITDAVYRSDNFDATSAKPWVLGYSHPSYGWKVTGPAMLFGTWNYYARLNVAQEGTDNPTAHLSLVHAGVEYGWAKVLTEKNIRSHAIEIAPASERRSATDTSAFTTYAYGDNGWKETGPALAFPNSSYKGLIQLTLANVASNPQSYTRMFIGSVRPDSEGGQQPWVEVLTEKSQGVMRGRGRLAEADADTLSEAGVYEFWGGGAISNVPSGYSTMLVSRGVDNNLYFTSQLLTDAQGHLYSRMSEGYTLNWRPWRTIIDDNNISSYAISQSAADSRYLKLIGGTVSGQIFIKTASNDRFFRSQSDSYDLGFGVGAGNVNRGIFDFTNSQWWIVRGSGIDTTIYGDVNIDGLLTANRGIRVASGQALSFIDARGTEHNITYDSAANAFKVDGSMYALGQLAAGEKGEEHKKVFDISSTATSTEYVLTHNFQTYEVSVAVYKVTPATGSTSEIWTQVIVDIEITSADSIKVSFYSKPLNTAYKVVVIG